MGFEAHKIQMLTIPQRTPHRVPADRAFHLDLGCCGGYHQSVHVKRPLISQLRVPRAEA